MIFHFFADDLLIGIFAHLPEGKRQFHYDAEKFHTFLYKERIKYPKLFEGITFNVHRTFPRSEFIDQALSNLTYCKYLGSWGYQFNPYEFSKSCKGCFEERIKPNIKKKRVKEIEEIAKDFEKEFSLEKIVS